MVYYENLSTALDLANMNDSDDYDSTDCLDGYQNTSAYINPISSVILIVCCIGLLVNAIAIWLLGFQIKRTPFTLLILNLAMADFGFLLCMVILCFYCSKYFMPPGIPSIIFFSTFHTMHINGLFLLTVIGTDRCISALSPECHSCSWPKYLSSAGCAYLWIFSFLLSWSLHIRQYPFRSGVVWNFYLTVIAVLCLPLTTISTVILFIKICMKPGQIKRGRHLVMTLITLLCFLILTLPLYIYMFTVSFLGMHYILINSPFALYFYLSACLNSNVKPMIYFLVGRKKQVHSRENIKVIFERVFRENEAL